MEESALATGFMSEFEGFPGTIPRESPVWGTENCENLVQPGIGAKLNARRESMPGVGERNPEVRLEG
jgi:hypothetical protein